MKHLISYGLFLLLAGILALAPNAQAQRGDFDREEWAQRIQERLMSNIQETLEAPNDEWEVLQPMVLKIYTLQNAMHPSRMSLFTDRGRGQFGNRNKDKEGYREGRRRGRDRDNSASDALREAIESNDDAKIKTALAKLRKNREEKLEELKKAQGELRQVVTLKQEANLVILGLLN